MKTPLQVITDYGCSTDSYIDAIQHFSDRADLSFDEYLVGIQNIIGLTELPEVESYHFAKTLFLYCVQETLRIYLAGMIPDMDLVYETAVQRTRDYIDSHPWAATRFNVVHGLVDSEEIDGVTGESQVSRPKGAKKEVTERIFKTLKSKGASRQDIIDAFVAETGMSKAGATTYFHSLKKDLGFAESEVAGKPADKVESKQDIAERLYQDAEDKSKAAMITLFVEKLETSKLGAQTYYYACKKKFAPLTETTEQ